jgi:hypothetical protein
MRPVSRGAVSRGAVLRGAVLRGAVSRGAGLARRRSRAAVVSGVAGLTPRPVSRGRGFGVWPASRRRFGVTGLAARFQGAGGFATRFGMRPVPLRGIRGAAGLRCGFGMRAVL